MGRHSTRIGRRPAVARGFTLVELLVVMVIIGILVGMTVPAVQYAREAARRSQCANNLKQLGLAALQHEEAHGFYPSGGWGAYWLGDPDRGFGMNQPGGWFYSLLPYLDQVNLHDLGMTKPGEKPTATAKKTAALQLVHTTQPLANCPSRRRTRLYPYKCPDAKKGDTFVAYNYGGVTLDSNDANAARTDYAGNVGTTSGNYGITVIEYAWSKFNASNAIPDTIEMPWHYGTRNVNNPDPSSNVFSDCTGVVFECSQITAAQIPDGPASTLLFGEKYVDPDEYETGLALSDQRHMYAGMGSDVSRGTVYAPVRDGNVTKPYVANYVENHFGSPHPSGCNFVFCDGSVRRLSFAIDLATFRYLGRRNDGQRIDESKLY